MNVNAHTTEQLTAIREGITPLVHTIWLYENGVVGQPHPDRAEIFALFVDVDLELNRRNHEHTTTTG